MTDKQADGAEGLQEAQEADARPVLRVVRGEPTPAELAALIAVVAARTAPAADEEPPTSAWSDRSALLRSVLAPGPGAWRWSSFATGHRTRADW